MMKNKFILWALSFILLVSFGVAYATPKSSSAAPAATAKIDLAEVIDAISSVRVYLEFYFMEAGEYPESLETLSSDLNSLLPEGLQSVKIPVDPATKKPFIYKLENDGKSYVLAAPSPAAYGLPKLEVHSVAWAGFEVMAKERKQKFLEMMCKENLKILAYAVEYYAKDNGGKYPAQLKDLIPAYLKTMPTDPATDKLFDYKVDKDNYVVAAPEPEKYGRKAFLYSSERGFVLK